MSQVARFYFLPAAARTHTHANQLLVVTHVQLVRFVNVRPRQIRLRVALGLRFQLHSAMPSEYGHAWNGVAA
jgi:hypothetical protein